MEIDYDKLAAAILRQQQQQPSVVPEAAINPSEQERGASSSSTGNCKHSTEHSKVLRLYKNHFAVHTTQCGLVTH